MCVRLVLTFRNVRWALPSELRRKPPVTGHQQEPRGHLPHRVLSCWTFKMPRWADGAHLDDGVS